MKTKLNSNGYDTSNFIKVNSPTIKHNRETDSRNVFMVVTLVWMHVKTNEIIIDYIWETKEFERYMDTINYEHKYKPSDTYVFIGVL